MNVSVHRKTRAVHKRSKNSVRTNDTNLRYLLPVDVAGACALLGVFGVLLQCTEQAHHVVCVMDAQEVRVAAGHDRNENGGLQEQRRPAEHHNNKRTHTVSQFHRPTKSQSD
jgi:hypothetical protein